MNTLTMFTIRTLINSLFHCMQITEGYSARSIKYSDGIAHVRIRVRLVVFSTFNNILATSISCQSFLFMAETGVLRENHRPLESH